MKLWARILLIACMVMSLASLGFAGDAPKVPDTSAAVSATDAATPPAVAPADPKAKSTSTNAVTYPAAEVFAGYSYIRLHTSSPAGTPIPTVGPDFNLNGFNGSIAGNMNRWFGLVADFGAYKVGHLPVGTDANASTYLFGPRFSMRQHEKFTPFVHVLLGAAHASATSKSGATGSSFLSPGQHRNAFATAFGGGLDWNASKHVAVRLFQGEYLRTSFTDGVDDRQNNFRAAAGLVFRFGGNPPPPPVNHPPVVSVVANPNKIVAESGDSPVLQATASDPDNDPLTYAWTTAGGKVEGSGAETRWNSAGVAPGTYPVTVTVNDGRGGTASASTDITVTPRPNRPPTVTCAASPATVTAGQPVSLTATGSDPDNDPLTYTWDADAGKIDGTGAQATLDTKGVAAGRHTVNCHANDGRGGTADGSANVEVQIPPEQKALEVSLALHSIYFPTAQPTVKNPNGGLVASQQRTLVKLADDFRKYLAYKPDARLTLQGHADPRGGTEYNQGLSQRRVDRTKSFLVEQGVAADRIDAKGLGEEEPLSADKIKQMVDDDQTLDKKQKAQLSKNAKVVALANNRRVDVILSTTGQTSVRQFPFNAEDMLNLINPKSTGGAKAAPAKGTTQTAPAKGTGTAAPKGGTKKAGGKAPATKK
ncbi:MAG TPA: PKD domain-containing protein [Alphaproteobacteria bacterium]|nr:PKD domain-containing protein [Alphaproteobacteria bacterium]